MLTRGRALAAVLLVLVAAVAWTGWQAWQVRDHLGDAQVAADRLVGAVEAGAEREQRDALQDLRRAAGDADDVSGGWWWGVLTHLPFVGDDLAGVRSVDRTLSAVADDGLGPLTTLLARLETASAGGRLDLDVVAGVRRPVARAESAFSRASTELADVDSSGFVGVFRTRFDDYRDQLDDAARGLAAGRTVVELLPGMAGANESRDYLLVFQNNAEIRATGGLPGAWARIHADDGELTLREQGSLADFETLDDPVVDVSAGEQAIYTSGFATNFASAGSTADFPRAAQIWGAFWDRRYPRTDLDGVIALDPVALSYLLDATGPVQVGDTTLSGDDLVERVLSTPYLEIEDPAAQDLFFRAATLAVFAAITGDLDSPVDFAQGLARAGSEGRFLVAPFREDEAAALVGTPVRGSIGDDPETVPGVAVGLNDATGSKMSYYLRYDAAVEAVSCLETRQQLAGSLSLRQSIAPRRAAELPSYVTGTGSSGTEPGSQLVSVQLSGPVDGSIDGLLIDGERVEGATVVRLEGRPTVRLAIVLDSRDEVRITWRMTAGQGQVDDVHLDVTPSIVEGSKDRVAASACG